MFSAAKFFMEEDIFSTVKYFHLFFSRYKFHSVPPFTWMEPSQLIPFLWLPLTLQLEDIKTLRL